MRKNKKTSRGKIHEVGEGRLFNGKPYIGISVDVRGMTDQPERKLKFETEQDRHVSTMILMALGCDPKMPPLPQLKSLVGRAVEVETSNSDWEGRQFLNLDRITLVSGEHMTPEDEINAALGLNVPGDVVDDAPADDGGDGGDQDNGWDEEEPVTSEEAKTVNPEEIDDLLKEISP